MHDSLLIGEPGVGEPGPFQASIADIDNQNHT
jgi:hypothetical protein